VAGDYRPDMQKQRRPGTPGKTLLCPEYRIRPENKKVPSASLQMAL